jgi:hypothetical protein
MLVKRPGELRGGVRPIPHARQQRGRCRSVLSSLVKSRSARSGTRAAIATAADDRSPAPPDALFPRVYNQGCPGGLAQHAGSSSNPHPQLFSPASPADLQHKRSLRSAAASPARWALNRRGISFVRWRFRAAANLKSEAIVLFAPGFSP